MVGSEHLHNQQVEDRPMEALVLLMKSQKKNDIKINQNHITA